MIYLDLILASLSEAARKALEMSLENYEFEDPELRAFVHRTKTEGKAEGRLEGKAESVLTILDARGIHVTDEQRQRILACMNLATLEPWVRKAATLASADELCE